MTFSARGFPEAFPVAGMRGIHAAAATCTIPANRMILVPAWVENSQTYIRFFCVVQTEPIASNLALHVFNADLSAQLYTSGSVATVVGNNPQTISLTLTRGLYWLGVQCDRTDTTFTGFGGIRSPIPQMQFIDGATFPHVGAVSGAAYLYLAAVNVAGGGAPRVCIARFS